VGYAVLLGMSAVFSVGSLVLGAVVVAAATVPGVEAALAQVGAQGHSWARGLLEAERSSESLPQAALDYAFSALNLAIAAMLLASRAQNWPIRLLTIAMVASAGAFNLQANAGAVAVQAAGALPVGNLPQVLLSGVAYGAYLLGLLLFPWDRLLRPGSELRRILVAVGVSALMLVGEGAGLIPKSIGTVLFFGVLVPVVVLAALARRQTRPGTTMEQRSQVRMLFALLATVFAIVAALGLVTLLALRFPGAYWPPATIVDPTPRGSGESGEPTALLFWFARFASAAIAAAVLVATRRTGLWNAEQVLSLALTTTLVVALVGGGFVVVEGMLVASIISGILGGFVLVTALATTLEALSFLPVHVRAERLVDRLLYGTRPTPYSVLAGLAALSRLTPRDAPDLARVAEAIARSLGATSCRLTVVRPGLPDRSYSWIEDGTDPGTEYLVEVPVCHGEERIGSIAVDRGAVVGMYAERRRLMMNIADSLGVVIQANRAGFELERQLRTAVAHAEDIAASRRRAVAEMDSERRRIERDLHDGAQHRLVALRLALGLVQHRVATAQFDQARNQLDDMPGQIETVEAVLADTVTGVSTLLLSERGLAAALELELSGGHPPVTLDFGGLDADHRFPADVEAAVYFCCLESVSNAHKHAPGAAVAVRLTKVAERLCFTVRDDGPGYDLGAEPGSPGRGLRNVQARMSAVGGRLEISSRLGAGTTVEGSIPLSADGSGPASRDAAVLLGAASADRADPPWRERRPRG
jgi:signal transduction histidine kinase